MFDIFEFTWYIVEANLPETSPFFNRPNGCADRAASFKFLYYLRCITLYVQCCLVRENLSTAAILLLQGDPTHYVRHCDGAVKN